MSSERDDSGRGRSTVSSERDDSGRGRSTVTSERDDSGHRRMTNPRRGRRRTDRLPHPPFTITLMDEHDEFPPIHRGGMLYSGLPRGMVVDRWECPACARVIDVVYRPGRPRLYCSHACRQRAYRWRRRTGAHTVASPGAPPESARAYSHDRGIHALRSATDPLSRRRDRRSREVTVCGLLARPSRLFPHRDGVGVPFASRGQASCRTCEALIQPRPLGLVPPDAMPPAWRSPWDSDTPDSPTRHRRRQSGQR